MAARGDVLVARRPVGFGASDRVAHFAVLQTERFASVFPTVVAAPIDQALDLYVRSPGVVRVGAREVGLRGEHVVVVPLLAAIPLERFEPAPAGRLDAQSWAAVQRVLRLLFGLG